MSGAVALEFRTASAPGAIHLGWARDDPQQAHVPYSPAMPAVRHHMSSDLLSVETSLSILEVAQQMVDRNVGAVLMLHGGFRHLPVVEGEDVVGVISIRDLVPLLLQDTAPRGV